MKHRLVLSVFAMVLFCSLGYSQQKRVLTLKEAIDLSVQNNKQLRINAARIKEATAATKEAEERKLPDVTVSGSYMRLNSAHVDIAKSGSSSGGSSSNTAGGTPNVSQAMYGIVNASLPIYTGGKINYGIESAKYLEQATKLDADNERDKVVINTLEAYDNLYKARSAVDLVRQSVEDAKQRVKQFADLEKNGLMARNDFLKAQLQESNTELALLDAENSWQLANINMNLILGIPEVTELVTDSSSWQPTVSIKDVEQYVQLGLQNRKDLAALEYRRKAANTGIKATQAEKLPSIALTGGYIALDVPGVLDVYNAFNLGVGVQYSLSSLWKNKSKVEQAKAREETVVANEAMLTDAIRLQIYQAYQNYLSQNKKIDVYSLAVAQAEENYKIVTNKYNNGLATVTDLLDADVAQLQARLNLANAKSDASVSYNKLLQTAGVLNIQ